MTKKVVIFSGKIGVTPSVAAPVTPTLGDATDVDKSHNTLINDVDRLHHLSILWFLLSSTPHTTSVTSDILNETRFNCRYNWQTGRVIAVNGHLAPFWYNPKSAFRTAAKMPNSNPWSKLESFTHSFDHSRHRKSQWSHTWEVGIFAKNLRSTRNKVCFVYLSFTQQVVIRPIPKSNWST